MIDTAARVRLSLALWGPSWASLGPSWRPSIKKEGGSYFNRPLGARKIASWAPLGALLGRSWALLGPSWASLGPLLGPSWAILEPSGGLKGPSEAKRREGKTHKFFLRFLKDYLGLSGASLGGSLASWAILGAPKTRERPPPSPGEGVGGGVNPSPKGKKGVGRREEGHAKPLAP